MTTDRPYRSRRPAKVVIEELQRNSGTQFAPEIVTAFLGGMLRELTGEVRTKRFRRLLGREYIEAEGLVSKIKYALNEMVPTSPMTYVAAAAGTEAVTVL
jgi:hypothetical protein